MLKVTLVTDEGPPHPPKWLAESRRDHCPTLNMTLHFRHCVCWIPPRQPPNHFCHWTWLLDGIWYVNLLQRVKVKNLIWSRFIASWGPTKRRICSVFVFAWYLAHLCCQ